MLEALNEWLYDEDPIAALSFGPSLDRIKGAVAGGQPYFERLIRKWLLDNPHRSTVTLLPDPEEGRRKAAREEEALKAIRSGMSDAEFAAVKAAAEKAPRSPGKTRQPRGSRDDPRPWPARICPGSPREFPASGRISLPQPSSSTTSRRVRSCTSTAPFPWTGSRKDSFPTPDFSAGHFWKWGRPMPTMSGSARKSASTREASAPRPSSHPGGNGRGRPRISSFGARLLKTNPRNSSSCSALSCSTRDWTTRNASNKSFLRKKPNPKPLSSPQVTVS